jgi:aspartate aminotransferase-like enzyme
MEAAVVNVLSPGDKALVVDAGYFGARFGEIAKAYGVEVVPITIPWGEAVDAEAVAQTLKQNPDAKAVYTTFCETSTGVVHDVKALGEVVRETDTLLVIDAISGLGTMELKPDDWAVDIVVAGSQKALMIPPGLAFLSVSDKAWKVIEANESHRYYFDLPGARERLKSWNSRFTPALALVTALDKSLALIKDEGIENVWARHYLLGQACRAGAETLGLELFAKRPADGLTAVCMPEGLDAYQVYKRLLEKYGVTVGTGHTRIRNRVIRLAHLGYAGKFDVILGLASLEMVLKEMGAKIEVGKGVAAAEEVFSSSKTRHSNDE